ncbi:MAG: LysM peptidoglycan-binding domain-containing protein [Firmicutes bacterium]|nr:LysM peptidoglycan-binding domain-containing protein [Bacillota bacterium]
MKHEVFGRFTVIKMTNYKIGAVFLWAFGITIVFASNVKAMGFLEFGSRGEQVREVQNYLYQLDYLGVKPTGYYGKLTKAAVIAFQIEYNLAIDGIVGPMTMNTLRELAGGPNRTVEYTVKPGDDLETLADQYSSNVAVIMARNNLPDKQLVEGQKIIIPVGKSQGFTTNSRSSPGGIQAISWAIVNQLWRNGEIARIIDVETGKSFQAKRLYGYYHADIEPLTKEDTRIMKEIYGGKWSWERRAVVVQVRKLFIAASINGMPHGGQSITDNDFNGQFCAHFLGSRVHQTGRIDLDHQAMIKHAYGVSLFGGELHQPKPVPVMTQLEEKKISHPKF